MVPGRADFERGSCRQQALLPIGRSCQRWARMAPSSMTQPGLLAAQDLARIALRSSTEASAGWLVDGRAVSTDAPRRDAGDWKAGLSAPLIADLAEVAQSQGTTDRRAPCRSTTPRQAATTSMRTAISRRPLPPKCARKQRRRGWRFPVRRRLSDHSRAVGHQGRRTGDHLLQQRPSGRRRGS